ncbi:hypothetical protein [Primorskyibacter sp. S87]|uniref:hypothetical protein n=1 Tax=Primorskyibacter sp. S87 TaxID=3415126 RepID=UPI003C7E26E6
MASGYSLKDQLFNREKAAYLGGLLAAADPQVDADRFEALVMSRLSELELKERISWIAQSVQEVLPGTLPDIAPVLCRALPPPLDPGLSDDDFGDFIFAPLGEVVSNLGLEHPNLSLDLLQELTQRFSMEWAIRPFLNHCPGLVLERMQDWVAHESYHVRRLVSEGTRPRLPWGEAVGLDMTDPLPLLDRLHGDRTRYVTRSVANHLNDITKKQPDLALERLDRWQALDLQASEELAWMTRHALRGLVKAGHPEAMRSLGYDPDMQVTVRIELGRDKVQIGSVLEFSCHLTGREGDRVLVDYIVHFQRPGGKVSTKVFKLSQSELTADGLVLTKRHKLKGDATTFRLVPGPHRLEVQVNGVVQAEVPFDLLAAP